MDAGDFMGKYAFTKMKDAIIKNSGTTHSKGFNVFPISYSFYWKRQGRDHVKLGALLLQSMNCRNISVEI